MNNKRSFSKSFFLVALGVLCFSQSAQAFIGIPIRVLLSKPGMVLVGMGLGPQVAKLAKDPQEASNLDQENNKKDFFERVRDGYESAYNGAHNIAINSSSIYKELKKEVVAKKTEVQPLIKDLQERYSKSKSWIQERFKKIEKPRKKVEWEPSEQEATPEPVITDKQD